MHQPELTPIATFGDLVTIDGFDNRLFRVDSYTHEIYYERNEVFEEVIYDCHCVITAEYMLAMQVDITIVSKEAQAEEYLRNYEMPMVKPLNTVEVEVVLNKPTVTKVKKPTKQARIDALLDERLNVMQAQVFMADEAGYYARRIDEIDAKIREVRAE